MTTTETETYQIGETQPSRQINLNEPIRDKLYKIALGLAGTALDEGVDLLLGSNITRSSVDELKQKLLVQLNKIKVLASDELIQQYVKEATMAVAIMTWENLKVIEEPLLKIADRILELIKDVSNKTISASLETALGVVKSAIAEVPLAGGVIDLILTAGTTFNRGSEILKMSVSNLTEMGKIVNEIVSPTLSHAEELTQKIQQTRSNVNQRLNELNRLSSTLTQ